MSTVKQQIEAAADALEAGGAVFGHGMDSAWDEATALVLGVAELADDVANLDVALTSDQLARITALLRRRIDERIPLAYLLGQCWFAGYPFLIEPGVVIPRSPIGELIERRFAPWLTQPPQHILDLCTGSGCIGIAAAHAFPESRVTLVDQDPLAVDLAWRNVLAHELGGRAEVFQGDLFGPLPATRTFDLIVSNPPYVDRTDLSSLPREYRHEPVLGLDGGADGLAVVRRILSEAQERLTAEGLLVCEVGMSAPALRRGYPGLPLIWPEFEHGGEGVFLAERRDLQVLT